MQWLADYWWIILILLVGMILNGIKELRRLDHKRFWIINRSYRPTVTIMPSGMMKMTGRIKIRKVSKPQIIFHAALPPYSPIDDGIIYNRDSPTLLFKKRTCVGLL